MTVCFTGHRQINPDNISAVLHRLEEKIQSLAVQGEVTFRAGGAKGFDTVAALCVIVAKEKYPHIKLHMILPCKNQAEGWSDSEIEKYEYVISQADSVRYTGYDRSSKSMLKRDRALVEGSDLCIAYCNKKSGGTAYTVSYAEKLGVKVENLYQK
ncbi:MAG: DUF1273 domain-containing protein [Ruminococcaceae bacterium]|nr:DUF1273 domain-containing protein [Oscillospiraceae bacterium]